MVKSTSGYFCEGVKVILLKYNNLLNLLKGILVTFLFCFVVKLDAFTLRTCTTPSLLAPPLLAALLVCLLPSFLPFPALYYNRTIQLVFIPVKNLLEYPFSAEHPSRKLNKETVTQSNFTRSCKFPSIQQRLIDV